MGRNRVAALDGARVRLSLVRYEPSERAPDGAYLRRDSRIKIYEQQNKEYLLIYINN